MNNYPLTQEGVNNFLNDLYSNSISVQINEQKMIRLCLYTWAPNRFIMTEEQQQYLGQLSEEFRQDLANQIAYAINHQLPITLDKSTDAQQTAQLRGDSVKVIAFEASQKREESVEEEPPNPEVADARKHIDASLIIRIFYRTA